MWVSRCRASRHRSPVRARPPLSSRLPLLPAPFPARLVAVRPAGQALVVPARLALALVVVVPVRLVLVVPVAVLVVPVAVQLEPVAVQLEPVVVQVVPAVQVARVVPAVPGHLWRVARPSRVEHPSARRSWMPRALRAAPRPESWIPPARRSRLPQVMVHRSRMRRPMSARAVSRVPAGARVLAAVVRRVAAWFIPRARMSGPPVRRPARSSMRLRSSRRQVMRAFPRRQSLMAPRLLPRPPRR